MANLNGFTHYYSRRKSKYKSVTQTNVDTNKDIIRKFRIDRLLDSRIKEKCAEKNMKFSELNRILWQSYFEVEDNNAWKREVENW